MPVCDCHGNDGGGHQQSWTFEPMSKHKKEKHDAYVDPNDEFVEVRDKRGLFDVLGVQLGVWRVGLWSCFESLVPNCAMATLLPCVSLAQITVRMGMTTYLRALVLFGLLMFAGTALAAFLVFYLTSSAYLGIQGIILVYIAGVATVICLVIYSIAASYIRMRVRTTFQIPGSMLEDCFRSFFCHCCVVAQMATHVKSYEPGHCAFSAPDTLPGYG